MCAIKVCGRSNSQKRHILLFSTQKAIRSVSFNHEYLVMNHRSCLPTLIFAFTVLIIYFLELVFTLKRYYYIDCSRVLHVQHTPFCSQLHQQTLPEAKNHHNNHPNNHHNNHPNNQLNHHHNNSHVT